MPWLVGGAAALLSVLVGGALAWLLTTPPAKPPRTAAAGGEAAASAPAGASSATATATAATKAAAPPPAAVTAAIAAASAPAATGAAPGRGAAPAAETAAAGAWPAHTTVGAAPALPGAAAVRAEAASAAGAAAPRVPAGVVASAGAGDDLAPQAAPAPLPLERLRRRLDEVLSGRGRVAAAAAGELRVVSASAMQPADEMPRARKAGHSAPAPGAAPAAPAHWHYGDGPGGPRQWGRLKAEYAACANGRRQSPIDVRDGLALDLEPLAFEYRPGAFSVLDNGHTVQVEVAPGNVLVVGGRRYVLQQFHFHRPSEERVDGRRYDMDVHLVHRGDDGRMAVVAVLLERGEPLPVVQTVWNHLPLERNEASAPTVQLDPAELLPADRRYATYMGSLTTPPCTEGVLWIVLRQPVGIAQRQVDIFARLYPMNARPLQASAGRLIKQSN